MQLMVRLKLWAKTIKRDVLTLWFAYRRPDTPLPAKVMGLLVVTYALSPIDLIPDFVPVLGYLDDLIIVPIGVYITVRLMPEVILTDCRREAEAWFAARRGKPKSYVGAAVIVTLWIVLAWLAWELFAEPIRAAL